MNDPEVRQYIQKLIEPLYVKIQELEKENNELKKRVGTLETLIMTHNSKTYNVKHLYFPFLHLVSRQNHLQESMISRREEDNRSVSGGIDKPVWKSITKIQQQKPISKQSVIHEKLKLKPPIPRVNSKTPTKTIDSLARQKSPPIEKKLLQLQNRSLKKIESHLLATNSNQTPNYEHSHQNQCFHKRSGRYSVFKSIKSQLDPTWKTYNIYSKRCQIRYNSQLSSTNYPFGALERHRQGRKQDWGNCSRLGEHDKIPTEHSMTKTRKQRYNEISNSRKNLLFSFLFFHHFHLC